MTNVSAPPKPLGQEYGTSNFACGMYSGDGTQGAIVIPIGFTPRYVKLVDLTDNTIYEYFEGMSTINGDTAVPNEDTLLTTGSDGDVSIDKNSYIQTNMVLVTATEMALNAPGSSSADEGVTGTTTVTYEAPNQAVPRLSFVAGNSGAGVNVSSSKYVWIAFG